jgi:DNA-binding response OmpR family regulator
MATCSCIQRGELERGEQSVSLPPTEMRIMLCLVHHAGQTVRRSALEAAAWGMQEAVTPNALDVALHRLRRKLRTIGSSQQIVNVRNHGYALREDAPNA